MQRFTGKTVIVTGSSSGIGLGCAKRFSEEGANVVLNSNDPSELDEVKDDFPGERTLIACGDVSDPEVCERIVSDTVERFGDLHILHNNAGIAAMGPLEEMDGDQIDGVLDVNVKGPGPGRESAVRALNACGYKIASITDVTPIPHNGCRPPKKRRV